MSNEGTEVKKSGNKLNSKDTRNIIIFCLIIAIANGICILLMTIFWSPFEWPIVLGLGMLGTVPAFIANAGMTFSGTFRGPGQPMDFGKNFIDGKRILGDGKTWKGFFGGILIGSTVSWLFVLTYIPINAFVSKISPGDWAVLGKVTLTEVQFFVHPPFLNLLFRSILLAIGACVGDCVGSFIKRRFNRPRGAQFPILDQIDFLLIAYLVAYVFFPIPWYYILVICLFAPLVIILSNIVAYHLKRKSVPW